MSSCRVNSPDILQRLKYFIIWKSKATISRDLERAVIQKEKKAPLLAVVIFAMNEQDAINATINELLEFIDRLKIDWELILVDDGSQDNTGMIMDAWAERDHRITSLHHETNAGIGAALKTGFNAARAELVVPLPADGQIPPHEIGTLLDALGHSDIVVASYEKRGDGMLRSLLSTGFRTAAKLILGVDPSTHGFYLARRRLISELNPLSDTFMYNIELPVLALKAGKGVSTVTVRPRARKSGESKIFNAKRLSRVIGELVSLRIRHS